MQTSPSHLKGLGLYDPQKRQEIKKVQYRRAYVLKFNLKTFIQQDG